MPHIPLDENLPGITGLLNYRQDTALPMRQLTQIIKLANILKTSGYLPSENRYASLNAGQ
jgi:hypothetical protein